MVITCICSIVLAVFIFLISIELFYMVSSLFGLIPKFSQQLLENSTQEFGMYVVLSLFQFLLFLWFYICLLTSYFFLKNKIIPSLYRSCSTYNVGSHHCQSYFTNFLSYHYFITLLYAQSAGMFVFVQNSSQK